MILAAERLAFGYRGRTLGRDLDLTLAPGRLVALLGPNGTGKTALIKTLLGLLPPQGGKVTLDGRPLGRWRLAERARVLAYVPQAHGGYFPFTVRDLVLMGRTAHGGLFSRPNRRDREVAEAALASLGIAHLAERPYTMVSGGERQLALVARALAQEPRLLILDEPTASLDFANQARVLERVASLTRASGSDEPLGVLFTTHDPNQALQIADRAVLLREGRIMAEGAPAETITEAALGALYGIPVDVAALAPDDPRSLVCRPRLTSGTSSP